MEDAKVQWAVSLFERGEFTEADVTAAVSKSSSFEEALQRLTGEEPKRRLPSKGGGAAKRARRQEANKENSPAEGLEANKETKPAWHDLYASPKESTEAILLANVQKAPRPKWSASAASPSQQAPYPVLSLEPRDARAWWREAAARWRRHSSRVQGESPAPSPAPKACATPRKSIASQASIQASPCLNLKPVTCQLCCDDVTPWNGVRLACLHGWYCQECIRRHAEQRLERGAFDVTCPQCEVQGTATPLPEKDLRRLLPEQLVELLLNRSLELAVSVASDIFLCPTPNCATPVAVDVDAEDSRFSCPNCKKTCCLRCGVQPWHKGMTCKSYAMKLKSLDEVDKKRTMRQKLSDEADKTFAEWCEDTGAKQCPKCKMCVTKNNLDRQNTQQTECHKMMCRNCRTKFCFKCLTVLNLSSDCGCTIADHGFIDPITGKRISHRKARVKA